MMMMRRLVFVGAAVVLAGWPASGRAGEPAQAFLEALRERNYFDMALEYLATAENNPAIPASFKATILYEKGTTLVQGAKFQRDSALREQQLDEAQKVLQQFVTAQPGSLYAIAARSELGTVMINRAENRVEKAKKATPAETATLHKQARELYEQGGKVFADLVEELRAKLKTYPAALDEKKEAKKAEERDRYRQDFLQAQLLGAATREAIADAMAKDSKEWTATLTAAADAYKKIYEDYRTRIAGLYARMYQGRCFQKMGKHKEATALFNELLANPDSPDAFRTLKMKVMSLAVDSWIAQQLYPEIVDRAGKIIEAARPSEERSDEMVAMRMAVARACKAYADQLKAKNPRDAEIRRLMRTGRTYVTYLTKFPNDYQEAARRLLPEFVGGDAETATARPDPKTFVDAKNAAKDAIDGMQTANLLLKTLPGRLATLKPAERGEVQKQLEEAKTNSAKGQTDAMHYCRLALKLADTETDINDLNLVRYLLCYLLYSEKSYFDSIVIGDFLAKRYPDSQGARQCAKIVLASYVNLYAESASEDKEFETHEIVAMADFIVKKWPDQPEADEALNTLIPFMIRAGKLDQALAYLGKIPTESPQRGGAELKTGQALWASYLSNSKQIRDWENGVQPLPEGTDMAAEKKELEDLKSRARKTLSDGVERMRQTGEASKVLATAVLSLAQIYVDTNEAEQAVKLLEDPKIGALTLVENDDPSVQDEGIAEETYKTALRANISSLARGSSTKETIEKARRLMDSLKKRMMENPQGQQMLVAIYVSLARDLQQQMEIADPAAKKALGVGFETFLKEVAADATELNVLNWVGDTYLGMGESFGTTLRSLTPESKSYFLKAGETYQKILDKGKNDTTFLPPAMATSIRIKLAKAKKYIGDYIAARDILELILKATPTMLPAQLEAAKLYQDWGGTGKGQQDNYHRAIVGARPDKAKNDKNTIWGWGEIARMTANNAQFKEQFYDARYNLALCRYQYALAQVDAKKKTDLLKLAKSDIALTAGLYPELGGEEKRKQYDNLLKNIQKSLGEPTDGLRALQAPAAGAGGKGGKTAPVNTSAATSK
jgi:Tetratricopeptide repeat